VKLAGKIAGTAEKPYLANPEIEKLTELPIDRHDSIFRDPETEDHDETLYPVYRETRGITSKWFYHTVQKCFAAGVLDTVVDPVPEEILLRYKLPTLAKALQWIHTPKKATHTEAARKRFAFEEVFLIQLAKQMERAQIAESDAYRVNAEKERVAEFTNRFPFPLTKAQERVIGEITRDFTREHPMSRLLEGDVGSGKTAVAATTAFAVATSRPAEGSGKKIEFGNLQVAYMAPTEILATQHFYSFIEYFAHLPIQIGLITGSGCMKFPSKVSPTEPTSISRAQLLKWVANGEIPILIGTHSLIQKSVEFKHLGYVIIDEQHRFGTAQRRALAKKDQEGGLRVPHLLSMTATPIPRTLALTVYGDLDLSLLDEMPKGRKPIATKVVTTDARADMYKEIRRELDAGRQAYIICPRIDEPDPTKLLALQAKSVTAEAKRLAKKDLAGYTIDILHSKMTPREKDTVMAKFVAGDTQVLVATSVVEVGVSVANATVIAIEGAERFGLAQLHQLRGRVIRSDHQAYCYVLPESMGQRTTDRLKALTTAKNGFELAEYDLAIRGSGELYGARQWGLTDLGMEAIKNIKMVTAARTEASRLVDEDPELQRHPLLLARTASLMQSLHFE
jgi:ATP-dependent DNA helicase RecG